MKPNKNTRPMTERERRDRDRAIRYRHRERNYSLSLPTDPTSRFVVTVITILSVGALLLAISLIVYPPHK